MAAGDNTSAYHDPAAKLDEYSSVPKHDDGFDAGAGAAAHSSGDGGLRNMGGGGVTTPTGRTTPTGGSGDVGAGAVGVGSEGDAALNSDRRDSAVG